MRFGKFEISEYTIGIIAFVLIIFIWLHFSIKEYQINKETEKLLIQQNIVEMETKYIRSNSNE